MPVPLNTDTKKLIRIIPYFSEFEDNELESVALEISVKRCSPGENLFTQGEKGAGLHLVVEGLGKIYGLSADGREQILYQLGPSDYCNEVSAADGGPNPASLALIEPSEVWVLTPAALSRLRKQFPKLNDIIIKNLAQHARQLSRRIFQLTFLSVKQRLALFIIHQSDEHGRLDRQIWPQDEIAAYLGTVRDVVSRAFKELREAGLIKMNRRIIEIVDTDALKHSTTQETAKS